MEEKINKHNQKFEDTWTPISMIYIFLPTVCGCNESSFVSIKDFNCLILLQGRHQKG